jgi:hypothetical protein
MTARRVALTPVLLALSAVLSAHAGPGSAESVQMLRNAAILLDGSPGDYDASWSSSSTAGSFQELNLGELMPERRTVPTRCSSGARRMEDR